MLIPTKATSNVDNETREVNHNTLDTLLEERTTFGVAHSRILRESDSSTDIERPNGEQKRMIQNSI